MSEENHRNKPDVKQRKLEEVHQALLSTNENFTTFKEHGFVNFCTNRSLKIFEDNYVQTFNDVTKSGKVFEFILQLLI